MRISKKFAGKSIGKHVFIARISSITMDSDTYANRIKLRELEQAFLKSVTEEINGRLPLPVMMQQGAFNMISPPTTHQHQAQLNSISTISVRNNRSTEFSSSSNDKLNNQTYAQHHLTNPIRSNNKSTETIDLTNQDDTTDDHSSLLQATNALHNRFEKNVPLQHPGGESLLPNGIMSMTDFLAGFDNVNNSSCDNNSVNNISKNNDKQLYSECQTTQSFDDLHKFLGKEIPLKKVTEQQLECNSHSNGRSTITITTVGTTKDDNAPEYDDKQPKLSTSPGDNVLISDEGLVHNSYCSIVKASYNCQDNDISAPTLTSSEVDKYQQHNPIKSNISYDDYALFAQSACNGIRDYYYSTSPPYKFKRANNNDGLKSKVSGTSCLGKRSADVSLLDM